MATAVRHGMETVASVTVDRPAGVVWKFMTDPANGPKITGCLESKQTSAGPFGVGTTWRETRSQMPKTQDYRVTEWEPNTKFALEIISGPLKGSRISDSLEDIEGRTKLTEVADFKLSGMFKLVVPFIDFPGKAEKEATDRLNNLKHLVESEAK